MKQNAKIYIADHEGFLGSAMVRQLKSHGYKRLILKSKRDLNLMDARATKNFFQKTKPEYVFLCAQKSGSIVANMKYPADFIYENIVVETNIIHGAVQAGVKKIIFFGASCMYPRKTKQPIKEEYLLQGEPEKTNLPYAISKIAGVVMGGAFATQHGSVFITVVPATAYGPGDDFNLENAHVISALLRKFHEAKINKLKKVMVWGSGKPRREFIYIDDIARASFFLIKKCKKSEIVNVGTGNDISIKELARMVKSVVGYRGQIIFDSEKPDGAMRKLLDSNKLHRFGWKHSVELHTGIKRTYKWYIKTRRL